MPPTDNDLLKLHALVTSMVVRNAMEDFHCDNLTDEQMKELNPIIRNAVYTALYTIHHGGNEPWCQRFSEHHLKMIPSHWEAPELVAGAKKDAAAGAGREGEAGSAADAAKQIGRVKSRAPALRVATVAPKRRVSATPCSRGASGGHESILAQPVMRA